MSSYGKVRNFKGEWKGDCPFWYQGQYEDAETGLYYNRFRYYSPDEGMYISQDPIRLAGGKDVYGYVHDPNGWVDIWGLKEREPIIFLPEGGDVLHPDTVNSSHPEGTYTYKLLVVILEIKLHYMKLLGYRIVLLDNGLVTMWGIIQKLMR